MKTKKEISRKKRFDGCLLGIFWVVDVETGLGKQGFHLKFFFGFGVNYIPVSHLIAGPTSTLII